MLLSIQGWAEKNCLHNNMMTTSSEVPIEKSRAKISLWEQRVFLKLHTRGDEFEFEKAPFRRITIECKYGFFCECECIIHSIVQIPNVVCYIHRPWTNIIDPLITHSDSGFKAVGTLNLIRWIWIYCLIVIIANPNEYHTVCNYIHRFFRPLRLWFECRCVIHFHTYAIVDNLSILGKDVSSRYKSQVQGLRRLASAWVRWTLLLYVQVTVFFLDTAEK